MAYNKQERFLPDRTCRPDPTRYQNQTFEPIKKNKHPFNSTGKRKPMSQEPATHQVYNAEGPLPHIPGGTLIRSNVPRFPYHDLGKDDLDEMLCKCGFDPNVPNDNTCTCETAPPAECQGKIQRKLFIGPTPGNRFSCPQKTNFGFDVLPDGSVKKICVPLSNETPGFYDTRPNIFTDYYHGCKWSRSKTERKTVPIQEGPGPADYSYIFGYCSNDKCGEKVRSFHRKHSKNLRTLDALCEVSKHFPGAADYFPKPWPRPGPPTFGPKDERFKDETHPLPGPGDYNIKRSYEPPEKVIGSIDRWMDIAPFGSRARRNTNLVTSITPGPTYDISEFRHCKRNCVTAPFNCSARRFKCEKYEDPASDEDCMEQKRDEEDEVDKNYRKCQNVMWPFKSRTKRFQESLKNLSPSPADRPQPGNDLAKRYFRLQYLAPFYSSAGRFRNWNGFPPARCADTPGPGYYELEKYRCYPAVVAGPLFRAPRFKPPAATFFPAPNEYTLPDTALHTHNFKLKDNIDKRHKYVYKVHEKPLPYTHDEKITLLMEKAAAELVPYPEPDVPVEVQKPVKIKKPQRTVSTNKMLRSFLYMRSIPRY